MSDKDDGGPAFPSEGESHGNPKYHSPGMTLRDWFAGQALGAMKTPCFYVGSEETRSSLREHAASAYQLADAMLEARK